MSFFPVCVNHSEYPGIQRGHQHHWDNSGDTKPREAISSGEPFARPIFHAEVDFFIIVDRKEQGSV